ncbi:MAG: signal recognition particle-docking protein FtsY [Chloroflexi bacterium RBG_16_48_8]|nr:MAG: signal recognition particle-docking protein FtsY [Chloroflexi bacterium RBG_16_48_8]
MEKRNWREALSKTRIATFGRIASLFGVTDLTPQFWDELEATMIQADIGVDLTLRMIEELRGITRSDGITHGDELFSQLRSLLISRLHVPYDEDLPTRPIVIILVGVNGSGKTTTVGRLAYRWLQSGKQVLLAAADTYRAAAVEQLQLWGERLGIEIIKGLPGSDPGAVVYNACEAAVARGVDALLIDTSGRMHTHHNLMSELEKICRVSGKVIKDAPHQVLLVLDATTGQNGIAQARAFSETIKLDGVIIAKLDSSARGGVGFAVVSELNLPILYVGMGENPQDLIPFEPEAYVDSLLAITTEEF